MKKFKKILVMLLLICITSSQCLVAEASTKSASKYKVTVNKTVYTMKKGKTVQLKATRNKAAKKKTVVWTTSNKKVATVSKKGKVTAKKNGKATITAKIKGTKVKATCKIVVGTPVKSIKLNKKSVTLQEGKTYKLKATLSPKKPTNKKVVYKSNKKSVATVSSKGVITAKKAGKAKITVTAADGTGKSATCTVTVKKVSAPAKAEVKVNKVTLSESNLSLLPGEVKKLTATVSPSNADNKTLTWRSTNTGVVSVKSDGTLTAVGEGTATITATASSGVSASCTVKVAYKGSVSNQTELNQALTSKMVTDIVYTSNASGDIVIPTGDYTSKTITFNTPNADITNNGQFSKVTINAIAQDTYVENSSNVIYFNAKQGHLVIGNQGVASINLTSAGNQELYLENGGYINDLNVPGKASLTIAGDSSNAVPVTLGAGAEGSDIVASVELDISSQVRWDMTILPGAENTKATVDNSSCIPSITGIGCIPIVVDKDNDVVNVPAEMRDDLGIDQSVELSGNIQKYDLLETDDEEDNALESVRSAAEEVEVYLLPYSNTNANLNEENSEEYISGMEASVVTDIDGNYSISNVKIGNYWIIVKKADYKTVVKNIVITSNNSDVYSCGNIFLLSNEIAGCENADSISGTIVDGLTGDSVNVSGLQVKLRSGNGNIIGEVLQIVQTDSEGRYEFKDVSAGVYTVEVLDLRQGIAEDAIRYNSANTDIVVASGYLDTNNYNCVVNQKMYSITGNGQVQFTLTWGTEESGASADIDSHLVGPKSDGSGEFHVYFGDSEYYEDTLVADLDVDDVDYEGPEHTTIYQEVNGIYRFYIFNFSERNVTGSEMLAKSGVQVRVTIGTSSYVYNCPNQIGNLWYVCDYNSVTHKIIPKNVVSDFILDSGYIGLSEEEINRLYLEGKKKDALKDAACVREYLMRFNENDAKTGYTNRLAELESQIGQAESVNEVGQISSSIYSLLDELEEAFCYPQLTADNLDYYNFYINEKYDEDDNLISASATVDCSILFGDTLTNFEATGYENQNVSLSSGEGDYSYIVSVTDTESGLVYDLSVKVLGNQAEQNISYRIQECERILSRFEENEKVVATKAEISAIRNLAVDDENGYNNIMEQLEAIYDEYEQVSDKFSINAVTADEGLEDWWTTVYEEMDENDNWLSDKAVLCIERDWDITDDALLAKLSVGFEDEGITYTMTESDAEGYQKLIKATDGTYIKKIYIKITEW